MDELHPRFSERKELDEMTGMEGFGKGDVAFQSMKAAFGKQAGEGGYLSIRLGYVKAELKTLKLSLGRNYPKVRFPLVMGIGVGDNAPNLVGRGIYNDLCS
jgi:hypothetical protein